MTADHAPDDPRHGAGPHHGVPADGDAFDGSWDEALCRLEDVLLAAPFDRALPDLAELLAAARVPRSFVVEDERATKLLGEAILARPFASRADVRTSRTHVEMMLLEVEVLRDRLRAPATPTEVAARAADRLAEIAVELDEVRDRL